MSPDRIWCFECVQLVHRETIGGQEHVRCLVCDNYAPLDKALDDCFVYVVASAATQLAASNMARSYRFMPFDASRTEAIERRSFMVRSGRALLRAA